MEHAVQQTPERQAFYKKIDGENLSALWNVLGALITPGGKCTPLRKRTVRDDNGAMLWLKNAAVRATPTA